MAARALVLGGGGIAGVGWEIGLLAGLAADGVDVRGADLVVGTSAGSVVGTLLRTRPDLEELYADQLLPVPETEPRVAFDVMAMMAALGAAAGEAESREEARAQVGALALAADTVPESDRRAAIASRIGRPEWPAERLVVTAVDTADGRFVALDRESGAPLLDAVTASCAVPAVWPPITVDGRRFMDGGLRSPTNADLAVGHKRVLVVAPSAGPPGSNPLGPTLEEELAVLRREAEVLVVLADEAARRAFGADPLDPRSRAPSARAGRAQAAGELAAVRRFWE